MGGSESCLQAWLALPEMGGAYAIQRTLPDSSYRVLQCGHDAAPVAHVPDCVPEPPHADHTVLSTCAPTPSNLEECQVGGETTSEPAGESHKDVDAEMEIGAKAGKEEE